MPNMAHLTKNPADKERCVVAVASVAKANVVDPSMNITLTNGCGRIPRLSLNVLHSRFVGAVKSNLRPTGNRDFQWRCSEVCASLVPVQGDSLA